MLRAVRNGAWRVLYVVGGVAALCTLRVGIAALRRRCKL
jgi:hypothetical protein